ncbi:hypothetical protein LBYZC6_33340 [Lacrimispora brassicae]
MVYHISVGLKYPIGAAGASMGLLCLNDDTYNRRNHSNTFEADIKNWWLRRK